MTREGKNEAERDPQKKIKTETTRIEGRSYKKTTEGSIKGSVFTV